MKVLLALCAAALLCACATPRPVVDTAALVAKMSLNMDRSVTDYTGSLKTARATDAKRLEDLQADAERNRRPLRDQTQIMTLAEETRPLKLLNGLAVAPDPDPLRPAGAPSSVTPTPVASFDGAPLKTVAKISGDIAQPRSALEQLTVLLTFAKTVNDDLEKATEANKKTAKP